MTTKPTAPATFGETLLHALEHFPDPITLGRTSPLATPYLLGDHLTAAGSSERARGLVLQRLLKAAAAMIAGDDAELHRTILEERYFMGRSATEVYQGARVPLAKTQYFTHQKRAVARLEPHLLDLLNPTLRLEQPILQTEELIARDQACARCFAALQKRQTVVLLGSGGVGKTSLGSRLGKLWGAATFWYTIWPGFNDHLAGFLFELAYFCHLRGASWLWQELIANHGQLPINRIPALVRDTLARLPAVPLLIIDEADLLFGPASDVVASTPDTPAVADTAPSLSLLQLLTSLRTLVPILAIGQRAALEADLYETLPGLSAPQMNVLLKREQILLAATAQSTLHRYTNGNPRLLYLFIALHRTGESLDTLLTDLPRSPSLEFLLGRILQRLGEREIALLMALSVFVQPAPVDVWQQQSVTATALDTLHAHHLIQLDQRGGVTLLPVYRDVIVAMLPAEKVQRLHADAAAIYQRRGRYTIAAYHLCQSGDPRQAIVLWRNVQQQEINRGQAYPALSLFQSLANHPLDMPLREQITLFSATLKKLLGQPTAALADLQSVLFKTPLLQIEADELAGTIANDLGNLSTAAQSFQRAIDHAEQLVGIHLAHARKGLGWRYRNERLLQQAWYQGQIAEYEVANFQGELHYELCRYREAIGYFEQALKLAHTLGHVDGIAKTSNNLGRIHATIGEIERARVHLEKAEECYREIGKVNALDGLAINRAFLDNLAGEHATAVARLQQFQTEKEKSGAIVSPLMVALLHQNFAEAYLGLGQLDEAAAAVQIAIAQEEIMVLLDAWRTHGEIKLQQGDPEQAKHLICHALSQIDQMETPDDYLAGYAWRALGHVYLALQNKEAAQHAVQAAIICFERINLSNEITATQAQFATLLSL